MGDALLGVIDHYRQLVGPAAIGTQQHHIAHLAVHVLLHRALQGVFKADMAAIGHAQADGRMSALLAGDTTPMDTVLAGKVGPAAVAGKGLAFGQQAVDGRLVQRMAATLVLHGQVGDQAECGQCGQLRFDRAGHLAWRVDILHPHQPLAVGMACDQPAAEGCQHGAQVQGPGRGGGEAAAMAWERH